MKKKVDWLSKLIDEKCELIRKVDRRRKLIDKDCRDNVGALKKTVDWQSMLIDEESQLTKRVNFQGEIDKESWLKKKAYC